jgi:ADP-ribose pyrophosphatase
MTDGLPSQVIYRGKIVTLKLEDVSQPIGGTTRFEIVEHADAVAIVAARYDVADGPTAEPHILLVRQQRPAVRQHMWEIPAGLIRPEEQADPEVAARRELREETGLLADRWQRLASEYPSPGFSTERITIYLATSLRSEAPGAGDRPEDPTEIEDVQWMKLSEALALWRNGEIEDGKTIIGLQLTQALIDGRAPISGGTTMAQPSPSDDETLLVVADAATASGAPALSTELRLDSILLEEFKYAGQTAYQALEDRARMFNLYLVVVGVLASGLGAVYQLQNNQGAGKLLPTYSQPLALLLLFAAGVMGIAFFLKLIRLRQAYHDSLLTMNIVKEFYIREFKKQIPDMEQAFRWRLLTVPSGEKVGSLSFYISMTVAMLSSFCFAAFSVVAYEMFVPGTSTVERRQLSLPGDPVAYGLAATVFVVFFMLHFIIFRAVLSRRRDRKSLANAAKIFGLEDELARQEDRRRKKGQG